MNQTEKLASAVYLIKNAGMQEKMQDAAHYVKQLFNPASDDAVWASRHKAKYKDKGFDNVAKVERSKVLGMLGGAGLGIAAGRAGGASLLKNLLKNLHLKSMGRVGKSNRILQEANDLNFAKRNMDQYSQHGKALGGHLGLLTGLLGGEMAGGAYAESQVKPDMIKRLRASGYPQN